MKKADLSQVSVNDLHDRVQEEKGGLEKMMFTHSISPIENPARIPHAKKSVARLLTEIRKRELAQTKK
jgi:large subunit ribosomal protein L29